MQNLQFHGISLPLAHFLILEVDGFLNKTPTGELFTGELSFLVKLNQNIYHCHLHLCKECKQNREILYLRRTHHFL